MKDLYTREQVCNGVVWPENARFGVATDGDVEEVMTPKDLVLLVEAMSEAGVVTVRMSKAIHTQWMYRVIKRETGSYRREED